MRSCRAPPETPALRFCQCSCPCLVQKTLPKMGQHVLTSPVLIMRGEFQSKKNVVANPNATSRLRIAGKSSFAILSMFMPMPFVEIAPMHGASCADEHSFDHGR